MFVWVFLTLIYPNAGGFLADRVIRSDPGAAQSSQIEELWEEFKRERDKYEKKLAPDGRLYDGFRGGSSVSSSRTSSWRRQTRTTRSC